MKNKIFTHTKQTNFKTFQGVSMKKYIILFVFLLGIFATSESFARRSSYNPITQNPPLTTFPMAFQELTQLTTPGAPPTMNTSNQSNPQISTGYYFVDGDDNAPALWLPQDQFQDTNVNPSYWRKVDRGPRMQDSANWFSETYRKAGVGYSFFRNPALPTQNNGNFFANGVPYGTDSTDDAIAGPIPINIAKDFYFNGIRYDSVYISTNGVIALTNRRYTYETAEGPDFGKRKILQNSRTGAYDPQSMDWFVGQTLAPGSGFPIQNRNRWKAGDNSGLNDLVQDDFGYTYSVLGGSSTTSNWSGNPPNTQAGIRSRGAGGINNSIQNTFKTALIAPFWGDNMLSSYNAKENKVEEHGVVWVKNDPDNFKFIVYYKNLQPKGSKSTLYGGVTLGPDLRNGDPNYVVGSAQVVLNASDSSVAINYRLFTGQVIVGGRPFPAADLFRWNTACGVRGFGRHVNFNRTGVSPSAMPDSSLFEYEQYTYYWNFQQNMVGYPRDFFRIKFKQWKNTLRVADIQYRVRKQDPAADNAFTVIVPTTKANNYELLAGEEKLGAIQPVAIIQNLSNDVQGPNGINYQEQDFVFQSRFIIVNQATGRFVYNSLVPIDRTCLNIVSPNWIDCNDNADVKVRYTTITKVGADYVATDKVYQGNNGYNAKLRNGLPPYEFAQIFFPPWEPNEFSESGTPPRLNNIGRMKAFIIAVPTNPIGDDPSAYKDTWPFDDTTSVNLFVMKRLDQFVDDVTEYHIIGQTYMPSVYKWVNINADVLSGDDVSRYPLAPRGEYKADNNKNLSLFSPVIHMNRKTLDDLEPSNAEPNIQGGDELRSYPIDMRTRTGSLLSLSVQRVTNKNDWERGYGDGVLVGPEPRTVLNGDVFTPWNNGSSVSSQFATQNRGDRIIVNFARPSDNRVQNITNLEADRWRFHPRRQGALTEVLNDALRIFGAGGYAVGFLENDRDSALAQPDPTTSRLNSLRANIYDDGFDFEYKKYFVAIPDTFIKWRADGARNFRFRIRVAAIKDQKCPDCIDDDADDFYVDNVRILFKTKEQTDIEVSSCKIIWPYTQVPATQAQNIPVRVKISNNTTVNAPFYTVKTIIYKNYNGPSDVPVYCRIEPVPSHEPGIEFDLKMPNFNGRNSGEGKYRMVAICSVVGGDLEPRNDTTYSEFELKFGSTIAYDPIATTPVNDVSPGFSGGRVGRGLNIEGYASGGAGSTFGQSGGYSIDEAIGTTGGSISGQIAMKFELQNADTIYGYQANFGTANQALDDIAFAVYKDAGDLPGAMIVESLIFRFRGKDDITNKVEIGKYVNYIITDNNNTPVPLVLPAGKYWASISQLGQTGLELCASISRSALRTMSVGIQAPITVVRPVGAAGIALNIHKEFRTLTNNGSLINNNYFALENSRGSASWLSFTPGQGNGAYSHLHHFGRLSDNLTLSLTRGSWIPHIRPFLGNKASAAKIDYQPCPDTIPVNLTYFNGKKRNNGIELFWETASEENSSKFFIEKRRDIQTEEFDWSQVGQVKANGNTNSVSNYNWFDTKVAPSETYQYRLRQVDFDGTQNCYSSNIVTIKYDNEAELELSPNSPNPFTANTNISFVLPQNGAAKLEVMDIFGNVLKTITNTNLNAGPHTMKWDGRDATGAEMNTGTYITKLTFGDKSLTSKMSLVK